MNQRPKPNFNRIAAIVNIAIFILLLFFGGELSMIIPKAKISEAEKRELTKVPDFSSTQLFEGHYTDSLDLHYSDNFPFRDRFFGIATLLKEYLGYRTDIRIYNIAEQTVISDKANVSKKDSLVEIAHINTQRHEAEVVNSIVIYEGKAFQLFSSSTARAGDYAQMINKYRHVLNDSIKIYCLIAPSPIDFYLPMKFKASKNLEKANIEAIHSRLDSGVIAVDAYSEIEKHKDEYLYFNTDHHWTGRGAYYAYRAFCESAGFEPFELSSFERRLRRKYLGSLYDITKDIRLKENPDSIESFRLPITTKTYRYPTSDLTNPLLVNLFLESRSYMVFLGGDYPLVSIATENNTQRNVLVIKDSYGNAVCPFLAMHFRNVFVIDYRYFETNILKFIRENMITDIIFLHNTFVANSDFTARKESYLMRARDKVTPMVKTDTARQEDARKK